MSEWESFLIAEVGASAVLTGLIFVGVSINLTKVLSIPRLPSRALEALILLLTALFVSSLLLVPGQSQKAIGAEVLVIGICAWLVIAWIDIGVWRKAEPPWRHLIPYLIAMNQFALIPYIIAGVTILLSGLGGLYWIVPAILVSFFKAILDAWILLVEINR